MGWRERWGILKWKILCYIKLISSKIGTCSLEEHFLELPPTFFLLLFNHSVVSDSL